MTYDSIVKAITFSVTAIALVGCGPEVNSRYGDEYWDPQDTWEAAAVITQPDLTIVYRDTGDDPDTWNGYVSVDFADLVLRAEQSPILSYTVGTSEKITVDGFTQNGLTGVESQFYYDSTNSLDYRLRLQDPEDYTFYLDFSVRQPNGTLQVYNFEWRDIVLPGPITRDDFWANRMNALINDNCIACHDSGSSNTDAVSAFSMNNSSVANLRNSFVTKVLNPTADRALPSFPFTSGHPGQASASNIDGADLTNFNTFANEVITDATGNDFTLTTIAAPTLMENDPYE